MEGRVPLQHPLAVLFAPQIAATIWTGQAGLPVRAPGLVVHAVQDAVRSAVGGAADVEALTAKRRRDFTGYVGLTVVMAHGEDQSGLEGFRSPQHHGVPAEIIGRQARQRVFRHAAALRGEIVNGGTVLGPPVSASLDGGSAAKPTQYASHARRSGAPGSYMLRFDRLLKEDVVSGLS
jgi:hypothetical protein